MTHRYRYDEETGLYIPEPEINTKQAFGKFLDLTHEQKIKWGLAYIRDKFPTVPR